jgi:hypothetical protein
MKKPVKLDFFEKMFDAILDHQYSREGLQIINGDGTNWSMPELESDQDTDNTEEACEHV